MDPLLICVFLLVLVLIFAHTVETVLGFGANIIALALGIFIFPLETILPVLVILGLLQSLWLVARWFKHIRWQVLFLNILPAAIIGMAIGISYRTLVGNYTQLLILLGVFIMAVSVMEIVLIYKTRVAGGSLPWYLGWPILIVGGIFHGIFASGSPLIIYYSSRELKEPAEFRATISMLWLILSIILIVNLFSIGQINVTTLATTGIVLPGLILGIVFGSRMTFRTLVYKVLIYALLFIAGMLLIVQQIIYR
ncbi:MAG: TSUP family transporter [Dehalococcoidia bacterium]|nr:TSUP family transporter [Dehalococcoidia bacterium]